MCLGFTNILEFVGLCFLGNQEFSVLILLSICSYPCSFSSSAIPRNIRAFIIVHRFLRPCYFFRFFFLPVNYFIPLSFPFFYWAHEGSLFWLLNFPVLKFLVLHCIFYFLLKLLFSFVSSLLISAHWSFFKKWWLTLKLFQIIPLPISSRWYLFMCSSSFILILNMVGDF